MYVTSLLSLLVQSSKKLPTESFAKKRTQLKLNELVWHTLRSNARPYVRNSISFCWYFIFYKFFQLLLDVFVCQHTHTHSHTHTYSGTHTLDPISFNKCDGFLFGWMFSCFFRYMCYIFMLIKFILFFRKFQFTQILVHASAQQNTIQTYDCCCCCC